MQEESTLELLVIRTSQALNLAVKNCTTNVLRELAGAGFVQVRPSFICRRKAWDRFSYRVLLKQV